MRAHHAQRHGDIRGEVDSSHELHIIIHTSKLSIEQHLGRVSSDVVIVESVVYLVDAIRGESAAEGQREVVLHRHVEVEVEGLVLRARILKILPCR